MPETVIRVEHLSKTYKLFDRPSDRLKETLHPFGKRYSRDFFALNDVSFEVKKGECIGLLGKNGAGKSTLLKILTGVLTPSAGEVRVKGKVSALLELGGSFNPEMTGMQNIYLNGTLMGFTREEMDSKVAEILSFADIGDFINQPVKMYSSGMFARLAFAVSVNVEPEILIIDEVLAVGDVRFQMKCMKKMKDLMSGGTTVLFVSHDINTVRRLCSRAIWFDHGKIIREGDIDRVTASYENFMKSGIIHDVTPEKKKAKLSKSMSGIAEIRDFRILDSEGKDIDIVKSNQPLRIEVDYEVTEVNIKNPVLGIAFLRINDEYICGLNTKIDDVIIPWQKGLNTFSLLYSEGLLVDGGIYYFTTALEDETASVAIHSISKIREIEVIREYIAEGIVTIPHKWGEKFEEETDE